MNPLSSSEAVQPAPPQSAPVSPLSVPIFRAVWIASMASNFGGLIQSVGASWLMTSLTRSEQMVALVQGSITLPIMMLSLVAGALADNYDRRLVMLTAQSFMLLVSVGLSLAAWFGLLSPWTLLAFTFLIGCGTALNGPAWQASVGEMVPRSALPSAVALNSMGFNIARSVGPALGGAIVAAAGAAAAFLANALSYIGLIAVLARWQPQPKPATLPRERIDMAIRAGARYVAMSPNIRAVLVRAALFGVAASAVPALMPIVARDLMSGGALTYGVLLGGFGIGAVCGALVSGRLRRLLTTENLVRAATLVMVAGTLGTAISPWMIVTIASLMLAGAGWVLALSTFNVSVQMAAPRWVVARALSLYQMAAFGGMAIGSWLFGTFAEDHGVATALLMAAGGLALVALLGLILPLSQNENMDMELLNRWTEPDTAVPIEGRSGPVVVTIEYRITPGSVVPFLSAMGERRRIRRRDGAHGWTLMRDLGDPQLWIERYHVSTWLDYVRHNQRRTHADVANSEAIKALHQGGEPPVVHRMIERQVASLPFTRAPDPREMADPMTDPTRSN